jgi:hypothetical protein
MKIGYRRRVALATLIASTLLSGCSKQAQPDWSTPVDPIGYTLSNPNSDARCTCTNSQAAFAVNNGDNAREVRWTVSTRDTLSNVNLKPIYGKTTINAKQSAFLGCTVHAPDTSCRFQAQYGKGSALRLRETPSDLAAAYGSYMVPSIAACTASCSDPDGPHSNACLALNPSQYAAMVPLRDMIAAAQAGNSTVRKADLMKRYNLTEADDKCGRGDIVVTDGTIVNEGSLLPQGQVCAVGGQTPTARLMKVFGLSAMAGLSTTSYLPRRIAGTSVPAMKAINADQAVVFKNSAEAPSLGFDGPGGDQLNRDFGGAVVGTAQVRRPGAKPQIIVATSNGCLSVEEP